MYNDISASEASSRLGLHVQTVQEFFETTTSIGLTKKKEVIEKKRPYFRYSLVEKELTLKFDLNDWVGDSEEKGKTEAVLIREKKNSHSHFTVARGGSFFSTVSVMVGSGRKRKYKKINLTNAQGKFLYHLPFPDANPLTVDEIINDAQIDLKNKPEIEDIVKELVDFSVIEKMGDEFN